MGTWLFFGVLIAIGVGLVVIYNRLVSLKNRFKNAFAQIDGPIVKWFYDRARDISREHTPKPCESAASSSSCAPASANIRQTSENRLYHSKKKRKLIPRCREKSVGPTD